MDARKFAGRYEGWGRFRFLVSLGLLGILASFALAAPPSAWAQDAVSYGGGASLSGGAMSARPKLFNPGRARRPNSSRFLAKPEGPPPQQLNREWFAKQAGKTGAKLTIDAVPPQSSVWVDGKFVGRAPLTLTLPAGKHDLSLLGPSQEHADQTVHVVTGKNRRLEIHLVPTYPQTVSISVFGKKKK